MTIHKEGHTTIFVTAIFLTALNFLLFYLIGNYFILQILSVISFLFFLFIISFFRKPFRNQLNLDNDIIYSPCDGKVVLIEEVYEPEFFKDKCLQIAVFMSPLNVHVNYYPVGGKVDYYKYHPGEHLVAWHPKSSTKNERSTTVVNTGTTQVLVRQIAGAVARRVVCYAEKNKEVEQNSELGFIKFGSRMDVYLPLTAVPKVNIGDKVVGTESILAQL